METEQLKKLISINSWSVAIQLVILATVVGGVVVLSRELRASRGPGSPSSAPAIAAGGNVEDWNQYIRSYNATTGSHEAAVTVLEFTDFQCPYCKKFSDTEREKLLEKFEGKIRFVMKNYPLEASHAEAKMAAIAAQCGLRGGRYWELERALFENSRDLSEQFVKVLANRLSLGADFATCLSERQTLEEVEQDMRDGQAIGVQGTPTFVVNGRIALGALMPEFVARAIDESKRP